MHQNDYMQHKVIKIHFIGIGGAGMAAIAEILHDLHYKISGSDVVASNSTQYLASLGIAVHIGHNAAHITSTDVVVFSSAITPDNCELIHAKTLGIPAISRAMMLSELMRLKFGIAVAGTHGKTTTTALAAAMLLTANLDPTVILGGQTEYGSAHLGNSKYLLAEADESDASFLYLNPIIAIITNIDIDHMNTYNQDVNRLKQAFVDFVHKIPFYGRVIACYDNKLIQEIMPAFNRPLLTYGFNAAADIYASSIKSTGYISNYQLHINKQAVCDIQLNLPGMHNILNSLAAIAIGLECDVQLTDIVASLATFSGVRRRCQRLYRTINAQKVLIIDDYAHHPTEIQATVVAIKSSYPNAKIWTVFQPHRYSRTKDLWQEFIVTLAAIPNLIITDIYAASEDPITNINSMQLTQQIIRHQQQHHCLSSTQVAVYHTGMQQIALLLTQNMLSTDILLIMGAGSICGLSELFI